MVTLNEIMNELELDCCSFHRDEDQTLIQDGDRRALYAAAITALLECAEAEGFTAICDSNGLPVGKITLEADPCHGLDGGCCCPSCTAQIEAVQSVEGDAE